MDDSFPKFIKYDDGCSYCVKGIERYKISQKYPAFEKYFANVLNSKREYQCILGISGGVDSSYLALKLKELNIRTLLLHVDCGWDTEIATQNISMILDKTNFDYETIVPDWNLMKNLQLAYLNSGVYNQDVPQDHAFVAGMYKMANKYNIQNMVSGHSSATENIPNLWQHDAMDFINIKSIVKSFIKDSDFSTYPSMNFINYYLVYPFIKKIKFLTPLDTMNYSKKTALDFLKSNGYKEYSGKHGESSFTRYFQDVFLPKKYGIYKIKSHLSSLIINGELTRDDALTNLKHYISQIDEEQYKVEKFFCDKLDITHDEYIELFNNSKNMYSDYRNWDNYKKMIAYVKKIIKVKSHRES
jgi:aminotransferase